MAASDNGLLAVETAYYDEHARELLLAYPNRFLLIHGDELIGTYESHAEAVADGVRRYGRGPFLVRRTGDEELVLTAPALTLGLLQCRQMTLLGRAAVQRGHHEQAA